MRNRTGVSLAILTDLSLQSHLNDKAAGACDILMLTRFLPLVLTDLSLQPSLHHADVAHTLLGEQRSACHDSAGQHLNFATS